MTSQVNCRFGQRCRRLDCSFYHPEGRYIDGSDAQPATAAPSPPSSSSPSWRVQGGTAAWTGAAAPPLAAAAAGAPAARPSRPVVACKFGWSCRRADCFFSHPEGRATDQGLLTPGWTAGLAAAPGTWAGPGSAAGATADRGAGSASWVHPGGATQVDNEGADDCGPEADSLGTGGFRHTEVVGPAMLALLRERYGQGLQGLAAVLQLPEPPTVAETLSAVRLCCAAQEALQAAVGRLRERLQVLRQEASQEQTEVPLLASTRCLLGPGGELRAVLTAGQHVTLAMGGFGPEWADEAALTELFERHGGGAAGHGAGHGAGCVAAVRVLQIGQGHTARVTMASVEAAAAARAALNNTVLPDGGGRLTVAGYQPPCAQKLFRPGNLLHLSWTAGRPAGLAFAEFAAGAAAVRTAVSKANSSDRPDRGLYHHGGLRLRAPANATTGRKGMLRLGGGAWMFAQVSKASRRVLQLKVCGEEREARVGPAMALLEEPERLRRALEKEVGPVTRLTVIQEPDPTVVRREQRPDELAVRLRSLLSQYGTLASLEIKPYDNTRQIGKAFASFSSAQACAAARQALDGRTSETWLAGRRPLRAHSDLVCRLRLDARSYAALRGRLAYEVVRLRAACPQVKVSVTTLEPSNLAVGAAGGGGGASIKVQGSDVGQVVRVKRELEAAIAGKLVTLDAPSDPAPGGAAQEATGAAAVGAAAGEQAAGAAGALAAGGGLLQAAMLFLLSAPGKALIKQIESELSHTWVGGGGDTDSRGAGGPGGAAAEAEAGGDCVHIRWDRALGQLRVFGSNEASIAAAEQRLRKALQDRQTSMAAPATCRDALSQPQFWRLLAAGGQTWLGGLAERHALASASLAFMPLGVRLVGEAEAVEAASKELRTLVQTAAAAAAEGSVRTSIAPAARKERDGKVEAPVEEEGEEGTCCPVCFCPPDGPHRLLLCGHTYCRACVSQLLLAAASSNQLPARCCAEGCGSGVSLRDCLVLLGPEQMERVHRSAFQSHITRHPEAFGCCLTPDCGQVYAKQRQPEGGRGSGGSGGGDGGGVGPLFACDCCLMSWCTACQVPWHAGQTCAQFKAGRQGDTEFQEWARQHTKPCPSCHVLIEKNHGCNPMTCSSCRSHFCWLCGEAFPSSGSTYDHLSSRHGGVFDYKM